jgi:hypothetical protein
MKLGKLAVSGNSQELTRRRDLNTKVLSGEISYRDSFASMLKSVKLPFPECAELLRDSELQAVHLFGAKLICRYWSRPRIQELLLLVQGE